MADQLKAGHEIISSDLQLDGIVQSLSDWAELDVVPKIRTSPSLDGRSPYGVRLANLHAARRHLLARIELRQRMGMPTADLEQELEAKRIETRSFLAYLESHARVRP
jgi:hypothetical protein